MDVQFDRYECGCKNLGPDCQEYAAVWLHGCNRGCKNCIAADWNAAEAKMTCSSEELADILLREASELNGIVLSGGEPFRQPEAILELLYHLHQKCRRQLGVMIYTGYHLEELQQLSQTQPAIADVLAQTDVLVDGPYVSALDDDQPYRGSANQRMLFLSPLLSPADFTRVRRSAKIENDNGEISLSGIPDSETKIFWYALQETVTQMHTQNSDQGGTDT